MRIIEKAFSFFFKDRQTTEEIFTRIFRNNSWSGNESVSGRGSDEDQTARITVDVPNLFRRLNAPNVLDIPCGDFNWMRKADLQGINYIGADIVDEVVNLNLSKYQQRNIEFVKLDLLTGHLPTVDIIFCRDCLVHFSFLDIWRALENICASGAQYLLTTNFSSRDKNIDIKTGAWRPLNFEASPFLFPPPNLQIIEECTESGGIYADKSLALWKIEDVQRRLVAVTQNL